MSLTVSNSWTQGRRSRHPFAECPDTTSPMSEPTGYGGFAHRNPVERAGQEMVDTTVTGTVTLRPMRHGRSWRSHRDTFVGNVDTMTSS